MIADTTPTLLVTMDPDRVLASRRSKAFALDHEMFFVLILLLPKRLAVDLLLKASCCRPSCEVIDKQRRRLCDLTLRACPPSYWQLANCPMQDPAHYSSWLLRLLRRLLKPGRRYPS